MARTGKTSAPRRPASNRSTSGVGYSYEDLVAAWFLSGALVGERPLSLDGTLASIHFQTRASGWFIDDLLITTAAGEHAALSCKSGVVVGRAALPAEFASDVRAQWTTPGRFDPARDLLVHVSQRAHPDFVAAWSDIKRWRSPTDPDFTLTRIQSEPGPRRILSRLAGEAGTAAQTDLDGLARLDRIEVVQLDLLQSNSLARSSALLKCQQALQAGGPTQAQALWEALIDTARAARLGSGVLSARELWRALSIRFALRDHPDLAADWSVLETLSHDQREACGTSLPDGLTLPREALVAEMAEAHAAGRHLHVFGDSGAGKSALVKSTLDQHQPLCRQVWLGPEVLAEVLTGAGRAARGIRAPLAELLGSSASPTNVLVLDSAEKLDEQTLPLLRSLLDALAPDPTWRVVLITQVDSDAMARRSVLGGRDVQRIEVGPLEASEVQRALRTRTELGWLASEQALLPALTNPRVLGWVIEAGASAQPGLFVSHTAVADHLWRRWTRDDLAVEGVVIRLALREADFERSFAFSSLSSDDKRALQTRSPLLPLHLGADRRFRFDHDLVADWARFQKLKEDAEHLETWAPLATHPMWGNALRLMAQDLLRRPRCDASVWDAVFEAAERAGQSAAADVLLDALALDPHADRFLEQRTAFLLAEDGKRLNRLLLRFHHVATTSIELASEKADAAVRLYMEARFRRPIIGRWGPIARFLEKNTEAVASLISAPAAAVCQTWLTGTPPTWREGETFPYRKALGRVALASAREVQIAKDANVIFADGGGGEMYEAALKAAEDLPDEIAAWVLEMAGRRPPTEAVVRGVAARRRRRWQETKARMRADPQFMQQRLERRGQRADRLSFLLDRDLPPWPLGPSGRVDTYFRRVCIRDGGLVPLMKVRPDAAAEALLALLIEDQPRERSDRAMPTERWALESDHDDSPLPPPLRSPFFAFLMIAPATALDAALRLIAFCMERWMEDAQRFEGEAPVPFELAFEDGPRRFFGDQEVLQWGDTSGMGAGHLSNLFAAMEKWFCLRLDQGEDIAPELERLLADGASVAFLALTLNIGKYSPALFRGVLRPLMGDPRIFLLDRRRTALNPFFMDGLRLLKFGADAHDASREWATAAYRSADLTTAAVTEALADPAFATWLAERISRWDRPEEARDQLELEWLQAALTPAHYTAGADGAREFELPQDIGARIQAFNAQVAEAQNRQYIVPRFADALKNGGPIGDEDAAWVAGVMSDGAPADAEQAAIDLACAGVLLALAPAWIRARPELLHRCEALVRTRSLETPVAWEAMQASGYAYEPELEILAWTVSRLWSAAPDEGDWWPSLLALALGGSGRAAGIVVAVACCHRRSLGDRWRRLLNILSWRVALSALAPFFGNDPKAAALWQRRMDWLRRRSPDGPVREIDWLDLRARVGRIERDRRRRRPRRDQWMDGGPLRPPVFNDHLLNIYFGWLTELAETDEEVALLERCWRYALERQKAKKDDRRGYAYPEQFERQVLERLAKLAVTRADGVRLSRLVLSAGPSAHHSIDVFVSRLFFGLEGVEPSRFVAVWRDAIEHALSAPGWADEGRWYDREELFRKLLGFDLAAVISKLEDLDTHIAAMAPLYRRWADTHLAGHGDNVAGLCRFLASRSGAALRAQGLVWIAAAVGTEDGLGYWSRHESVGEAVAELVTATLASHADQLRSDAGLRNALVVIVGDLLKRQVSVGLVLQERLKALDEAAS